MHLELLCDMSQQIIACMATRLKQELDVSMDMQIKMEENGFSSIGIDGGLQQESQLV